MAALLALFKHQFLLQLFYFSLNPNLRHGIDQIIEGLFRYRVNRPDKPSQYLTVAQPTARMLIVQSVHFLNALCIAASHDSLSWPHY